MLQDGEYRFGELSKAALSIRTEKSILGFHRILATYLGTGTIGKFVGIPHVLPLRPYWIGFSIPCRKRVIKSG
jgi:hypothetical protein